MNANSKNSAPPKRDSHADVAKSNLPPLKALLAFEAASRCGSFSQGAEELSVTPSAISHHIQQLEDFLGVPLFQRHAGRAVLTTAGRAYAGEIERAFALIANATHLVAPQSQSGHLVIASGPSFAAKWLQPRIADFLVANPAVKIRLSTLTNHDDLDTSRFDIAIAYGAPSAPHRHVEPLLTERIRPLCSPGLASAIGLRRPEDLARATLIHSANALTWVEYLRRVGGGDIRPHHELWFDRSMMAIEAAVTGLGVILESEFLAAQELRDGKLVAPFTDPSFDVQTTTYFLIKAAGSKNRTQIAAFEAWLRAAIVTANLPSATAIGGRSPD
jgi:LysR family transcriptional regulator, glycine cleavage system transcriptional activator